MEYAKRFVQQCAPRDDLRAPTHSYVFDTPQLMHVLGHLPVAALPKLALTGAAGRGP